MEVNDFRKNFRAIQKSERIPSFRKKMLLIFQLQELKVFVLPDGLDPHIKNDLRAQSLYKEIEIYINFIEPI